MKIETPNTQTARLATLARLAETLFAAHLDPVPPLETLRNWMDEASVPRFKSNPLAKRGGGLVYYSVPATEKMLRTKLLPGTASSIRAGGAAR